MKNLKNSVKSNKKLFAMCVILFLIILSLIGFISFKKSNVIKEFNPELVRAMNYEKFLDGDDSVDGTDNIKFSAFFLRDLDGDGYADKLKGTCKEIGKDDTLYMELDVQNEGSLKNAKIEVDGKNFYLAISSPKDAQLKENYITANAKKIEFNDLSAGTKKVFSSWVRSGDYTYSDSKTDAISSNLENLSRNDNKIILTGIYVKPDGSEVEVKKEISLTVDWYGTVKTDLYNNTSIFYDLNSRIDNVNNTINLNIPINVDETKKELIIKKNCVTGNIPKLNGYNPIEVTCSDENVKFSYNENTNYFELIKEASLDSQNNITIGVTRNNLYTLNVVYPLEAYITMNTDNIQLDITVSAYYEGYNNSNPEFTNPEKSQIDNKKLTYSFRKSMDSETKISVSVGKYVTKPNNRYIVSKKNILNLYNERAGGEVSDNYSVRWYISKGTNATDDNLIMADNSVIDNFICKDTTQTPMEGLVSNIGIAFSGADMFLNDNGWIKVYDNETNELLASFTKENWSNYTEENFYKYKLPAKHIRVETSSTKEGQGLYVYNIKEIDNEKIMEKYTADQFDNFQYIESKMKVTLGDYSDEIVGKAVYETPYSIANVTISNDNISTQTTEKNEKIEVIANCDENSNQIAWENGTFLLKLPDGILMTNINNVTIDNSNVQVKNYEYFENDEGKFIKIITQNNEPEEYKITLDTDITPDPRIATTYDRIVLWASNENGGVYYYNDIDRYDVNGNSDKTEKVNRDQVLINLNAPEVLLTNQIATEYNDKGSLVVSPQIAEVEQTDETVKIGIQMKNNYNRLVSDVKVLGVIPFEGNTNVLNGENLNSEFTTEMVDGGIEIPENLNGKINIYYSENEKADKDLQKESNGWKLAENVNNWNNIKMFLIDFKDESISVGEEVTFYYKIRIPENINYNKITYSHYGIEYTLNTAEGKFKMQAQPTKLGIRTVAKFDLQISKYQSALTKLLPGAMYKIQGSTVGDIKTGTTDANGQIIFNDLYVHQDYELLEIKAPENYEINEKPICFNVYTNDKNEYGVNITNLAELGNDKFYDIQEQANNKYLVKFQLEDSPKAILRIKKVSQDDEKELSGVRYKLSAEGETSDERVGTTDNTGTLDFNEIKVGKQYKLEETKATGYYLANPITFEINQEDNDYIIKTVGENVKQTNISIENNLPVCELKIEDEKIPTYNLEITKRKRELNGTSSDGVISGAKFRLYKDSKLVGEYTTDENGKITINNLYKYIVGKDEKENGEYVLKEISTPSGFSKIKDMTFKVKQTDDKLEFISDGNQEYTVQDDTVKVIIEDSPYFEITAKDAETNTPVVGAKFVIYSEEGESQFAADSKGNFIGNKELIDNNEYYVVTTNTDGKIILDLPEGKYTAKEIVADEKYDITNSEYKFSVGAGNEEYGEIQKLNIPHERKEFKICTSVAEICGAKGGNISGEDEKAYETVKFGDSSTKKITITPKEGYELIGIKINDEEYKFTTDSKGEVTIPSFDNVQEDKTIVASFVLTQNKITIKNVDSITKNSITGGVFELKQIEKAEADSSEMFEIRIATNYDGIAITQIPFGKYELKQITAPIGYFLEDTAETIDFTDDGVKEFTVENDKMAKLIVHHYLKGTTEKVAEDEEYTSKIGDDYTTTPKIDLEKYELQKDANGKYILPTNSSGKYTESTQEIVYYYEERLPVVKVYHYLQETETRVPLKDGTRASIETISGKTGTRYSTSPITTELDDKYELAVTPENASGEFEGLVTNVIYYYKLREYSSINVRYIDKTTGKEIAPTDKISGKIDEEYNIITKNIEGYTFDSVDGDTTGKFGFDTITITYYYLKNTKVAVQYVDKISNTVISEVVKDGVVGESFTSEGKSFDKYILIEEPAEKTVIMTENEIILKYYYIHVSEGVVEKHIDLVTGEILSNSLHSGKEGDSYEISAKSFDGYDLDETKLPENSKGTMGIDAIEVIYYYKYKASVLVQYLSEDGKKLVDDVTLTGYEGDSYESESKSFDGYFLKEVPENTKGIMTKTPINVVYKYSRASEGVVINYFDIDTNEKLAEPIELEGLIGDAYKAEKKSFDNYNIVKEQYPQNANGKMIKEKIEVNYYYKKKVFNFNLSSNISKIKIDGKEIDVNNNFAKAEIERKEISIVDVEVIYKVVVRNDGEISGKASVMEKIPYGMTMVKEDNPEWNISESVATIETDELNPGEEVSYNVVLKWKNAEKNLGTKENVIEFASLSNNAGFTDMNEVDNVSRTEIIFAISTGENSHIIIASIMLIIMITEVTIIIKKK